jgi:membrane protease YdiL (CAAX protease family)
LSKINILGLFDSRSQGGYQKRIEFMEPTSTINDSSGDWSSLQPVLRKHPLFYFFLIAYVFSWVFLMPSVLAAWGIFKGDFLVTFSIHTFGPAFAAVFMTYMIEGKEGLQRLRERIRQVQAGWQWYLFILVGIPALIILGIIIQPGALASFKSLELALLVSYPINFILVWFGGGPLGEEIGWRGFALPRMQPRYGPLWGTLLLGVLWTFWHLPEFLMPTQGGGPGTGITTFVRNFSLFFFMILAISIIFTWIFNHTRQSVFIAITAHASIDTPQLVFVPLFLAIDYSQLLLAGFIGFGAAALLILVLTRARLGYQPYAEAPPEPGAI